MIKQILMSMCISVTSVSLFASQTITFATEATYPPIVSMDNKGTVVGFEAELVNALCDKLVNTTCVLIHQPWDGIIPGLQFDKFDAAFGGLGVTEERAKQVSFTHALYENPGTLLFMRDKHFSLEDQKAVGKTIGVQAGTTFLTYLRKTYPNKITVKSYASIQEALMDLEVGRIDAIFGDGPVIKYAIKSKPDRYTDIDIPKELFYTTGNAIAVKKGNTKLLDQLNEAIDAINTDGTFDKIYKKYF